MQDPVLDITVGVVLPTDETSTEYIVQMAAPAAYGWTGVSMGGQMANSLLFVMWPNDNEVVLSTRWTALVFTLPETVTPTDNINLKQWLCPTECLHRPNDHLAGRLGCK